MVGLPGITSHLCCSHSQNYRSDSYLYSTKIHIYPPQVLDGIKTIEWFTTDRAYLVRLTICFSFLGNTNDELVVYYSHILKLGTSRAQLKVDIEPCASVPSQVPQPLLSARHSAHVACVHVHCPISADNWLIRKESYLIPILRFKGLRDSLELVNFVFGPSCRLL